MTSAEYFFLLLDHVSEHESSFEKFSLCQLFRERERGEGKSETENLNFQVKDVSLKIFPEISRPYD